MSTDTLFEQHTIKEIQETERKLRNDIEHKKEELRQMVGERYRDLMEAADTITEMKLTSERVAFHILAVGKHCDQLQKTSRKSSMMETIKSKVAEKKKQNENLFVIAAMIKILMDCPAKIWSCIEMKDYLSALKLFLLARHTHSLLVLDPVYSRQNILSSFPIINKQWVSTRHFQHVLLQRSKDALKAERLVAEDVIGPLCCILFLSDASLEQVFQEVLATRKGVALNVFKPEKSAKVQVCELMEVIQNTLEVIHTVFCPIFSVSDGKKTNLLQNTIDAMVEKNSEGPISLLNPNTTTFQFLGKDVTTFRPSINVSPTCLDEEYIQKICQEWIQSLKIDLEKYLCELLNYVASVKGLSLIKEAVAGVFHENSPWNEICNHLFKEQLCLWECFLKENFISRTKDIISGKVEDAVKSFKRLADQTYNDLLDGRFPHYNESISSYIWTESDSDLAPNLGWTPHHQRHIWDSGTLGMKSYSLMPRIQNICSMLDKSLDDLLKDINCFAPSDKNLTESSLENEILTSFSSKEKRPDSAINFKEICSHLTNVSEKNFESLISHFEKQLKLFEESDPSKYDTSGIIFSGHLSRGVTKLCPHMLECLQCESLSHTHKKFSSGFTISNKDDVLWSKLKERLLNFSDNAFRTWSQILILDVVNRFKSDFVVFSETNILKSLLQWEKIAIKEENEEGESVESILRIPQQVSVQLYSSIYTFCLEYSKIGGHAISCHVRFEIREKFLQMLMETYAEKIINMLPGETFSAHLAQTQSLQLFFDLQFLTGLIGPREKDEHASSLSKDVLAKVIANIDPFDMDVFSPYLQANLKKALQKSLLVLSLVVSPEQAGQLSSLKLAPPSGHDEHNLMLTPSNSCRLPLLPFAPRSAVSITSSLESANSSVLPSQAVISRSHSSSPNFSASDDQPGVMKSSSFYDRVTAMSTSWFGGT